MISLTRSELRAADALLFPGVEDFGMLPVEAQACGTPVIASAAGGALETVIDSVTGRLVDGDDVESWREAIERFEPAAFDGATIRAHAESFAAERFDAAFRRVLADADCDDEDPRTSDQAPV